MHCMHEETIIGWVVVRMEPWDLRGPFPDRDIALKLADTLNGIQGAGKAGYEVKWGQRPASKLRDNELAYWKGVANDTKGSAVRSRIDGRPDNRKPKARAGRHR